MFHVYRDKALRNVFLTNFTLYCSLTGSDVTWSSSLKNSQELKSEGRRSLKFLALLPFASFNFYTNLPSFAVFKAVSKFYNDIQILLTNYILKIQYCIILYL